MEDCTTMLMTINYLLAALILIDLFKYMYYNQKV